MSDRLKTSLWVEAHVRANFGADRPTFVVAKGDGDRGGVILQVNRFAAGVRLYEQTLDFDGNKMWRQIADFAGDSERENDQAASMLVAKKRGFDPDIWVLEIEDGASTYELDAPLSEF
jgi:hypothetical protein